MKNTSIVPAALACALAALGFSGAGMANGAPRGHSDQPTTLLGTWNVVITPYNCATNESYPSAAFRSLFSFAAGGVMTETTSNPSFQPGQRSIGLGYWERTGRYTYRSVFQAFVQFDSPSTPQDPPIYQRGVQRLDQGIDIVDYDHWTSTASVSWADMSGTPLWSGCATIAAERMH